AHPAFTLRFWDELRSRELRVPLTKDPALFQEACKVGAYLLWLHTYGERYADAQAGRPYRQVPAGRAKCVRSIPDMPDRYPQEYRYADGALSVGEGVIEPVAPELWDFEVSGQKVVASWLKYRVGTGGGKKSSPLDGIRPERWTLQMTSELLELLWVIEHTLAMYPQQADLLERIWESDLVLETELPPPPEWMRPPPNESGDGGLFGAQ
ncbi:MAG: DNA methyltransferase, partial [bacterium]|nr:DNA methyltransferase [bacterium]